MTQTADAITCGAGITGVSAARFLSKAGFKNILVIDEHSPLSFISERPLNGVLSQLRGYRSIVIGAQNNNSKLSESRVSLSGDFAQ